MTVAALAPAIEYLEDGVTLAFPVPFRFLAPQHLLATRTDTAGIISTLTYGTDYTATGGGSDAGGTLTLTASLAGARLLIRRGTPRAQTIDYQTNDRFPAETHELGLDRDMLIEQEQDAGFQDLDDRALKVPPGETVDNLPPAAQRANLFLAFDSLGEPLLSRGTGSDSGLRQDLAAGNGAALVGFIQAGAGAVARTAQAKMREAVSVLDFGAKGDGVTNDKAAIQAAIAYVAIRGGVLRFPPGDYYVPTGLMVDQSADTLPYGSRVSFFGEGSSGTRIVLAAGAYTGLTLIGSNVAGLADAQVEIDGLYFDKPDRLGSCLSINRYSHIALRDLRCNGSQLGIACTDVQESQLENVIVSFADGGIKFQPGVFTSPNAITLHNCKVGNCNVFGVDLLNAALINITGGSYEGNNNSAIGGTAPTWAIRCLWDNAAVLEGTVGLNVDGAYIENNGLNGASPTPTGDIWIVNSVAAGTYAIEDCSFQRHAYYCTNNIRMETSGGFAHTLKLGGNGHKGYGDYTENAGRPYIYMSNPGEVYVDAGKNRYISTLETPGFSGFNNMLHAAMAQVLCRFDGTGANGAKVPDQAINVASLNKTATGQFVLTFSRALGSPSNKHIYAASIIGNYGFLSVTAETANSVTFQTANGAGALTDYQVCLSVFGAPAL